MLQNVLSLLSKVLLVTMYLLGLIVPVVVIILTHAAAISNEFTFSHMYTETGDPTSLVFIVATAGILAGIVSGICYFKWVDTITIKLSPANTSIDNARCLVSFTVHYTLQNCPVDYLYNQELEEYERATYYDKATIENKLESGKYTISMRDTLMEYPVSKKTISDLTVKEAQGEVC